MRFLNPDPLYIRFVLVDDICGILPVQCVQSLEYGAEEVPRQPAVSLPKTRENPAHKNEWIEKRDEQKKKKRLEIGHARPETAGVPQTPTLQTMFRGIYK